MSIHYQKLEIHTNAEIDEKTLYSSLYNAITTKKSIHEIKKLLEQGKKNNINVAKVVSAVDDNGDTLLIDAIKKDIAIAKTIFTYCTESKPFLGNVKSILEEKTLDSIINGDGSIAKKIIEFSKVDKTIYIPARANLMQHLTEYIKTNEIDKAGKIFHFIRANPVLQPIDWNFHDIIMGIKKASHDTQHLTNTLGFAKKHGMLKGVFKANVYGGKNLFQFAEEQGVKAEVEQIINELKIDVNQYKQDSNQKDDNGGLFAKRKGDAAILVLSSIVGAVACFILEWPVLGAIAIGGAIAILGILGKAVHSEYKAQDPDNKSILKAIGSVFSDMVPECLRSQKAV